MITNAHHELLKINGIILADDPAIICAAAVISQALEANTHFRVDVLEKAFENSYLDPAEYPGFGDALAVYMKSLANMPIESHGGIHDKI